MRIALSGLALLLLACIFGCSNTPLLSSSDKDVGAVLLPISHANLTDARAEFRELFCAVNEDHGSDFPDYRDCIDSLHLLSDESINQSEELAITAFQNRLRILVVPGIFGECLINDISPFSYALAHLNEYSDINATVLPDIRGRASSEHNSNIIHEYLRGLDKGADEKLVMVAYSKGTTDMLHYFGDREAHGDTIAKIDAMVSITGVVNGTPIADDTSALLKSLAKNIPYGPCPAQDASGIEDLTRENQFYRLAQLTLPNHIQYFSLAAYAEKENISDLLKSSYERLALVDPRNDGQVIYFDSILPGAHLLGYANADHWAVALPFSRHTESLGLINKAVALGANRNEFPREVLLEAIVRFVDSTL